VATDTPVPLETVPTHWRPSDRQLTVVAEFLIRVAREEEQHECVTVRQPQTRPAATGISGPRKAP
jgi:hypothetical protein